MLGLRESFDYFQCVECGCLQILEVPADMSRYYPASYYSLERATPPSPSSGVKRWAQIRRNEFAATQRGLVGRILSWVYPNEALRETVADRFPGGGASLVDLSTSSRILDVGCGSGAFLLALQEAGFRKIRGVDLYVERDIEYSDTLRISKGSIAACRGEWDIVTFHHSFEHLDDPGETLKTAAGLLAAGGSIVIRIPIVSSYAWEKYGVAWVQLDAPRHFFLHSRESMARLAETAGLRVARVVYDSTDFQFLGSELYLRDIPLMSEGSSVLTIAGSSFSPDEVERFRRQAAELNASERGDQAAFYLRKM